VQLEADQSTSGGKRGGAVTPGGVAGVAGTSSGELGVERRRGCHVGRRAPEESTAPLLRRAAWQAWRVRRAESGGARGASRG